MSDDLSPFFESRETRVGRLPADVRPGFESAQKAAADNGQTDFGDRQFVSLWLSRRTGLPRKEVMTNFDGINERFFGKGSTAATAYDSISKEYAPKPESTTETPVPASSDTETAIETTGLPKAGKSGFLYYAGQSGRNFMAGYTGTAQQIPAGIFSQIASLQTPMFEDGSHNQEYRDLQAENSRLSEPIQNTFAVYDEPASYGPSLSEVDDAKLQRNQSRMAEIVATTDAANREKMKVWMDSPAGQKAKVNRGISDFWYDLSKGAADRFKVDPAFAQTAVGGFTGSAGSVPATAALAMFGPGGWVAMEGQFFADVESERRDAQGDKYDPTAAFGANLVSAAPQMVLERAFGVERLLGEAVKEVPKFAKKMRFGDYARTFFKKALESGVEEGITEPAQGAWNDYVASLTYDEKREVLTGEGAKRRLVESVSAFALGSLFGGGIASLELRDESKAHGNDAPEHVVSKDNLPMTEADFRALGDAKTDEQLMATAPTEQTGKLLVAAARGNVDAQTLYNSNVAARTMIETKGTDVAGMKLSDVDGVPVVTMEDGFSMPLDLTNEEDRAFFDNIKQQAAQASQITDNVTIPEVKEEAEEPPVIFRSGEAGNDEVLGALTKKDRVYRGMTSEEYEATVGKGLGAESRKDFSLSSEGTSFAEHIADAESYVNFGRDDPRKTGKPTYLIEAVRSDDMTKNRQGYIEGHSPAKVSRVWEMSDVNGEIHAKEVSIAPELTPQQEQGLAERAIKALENLKIHKEGSLAAGSPISVAWDSAIETAIVAIKAGKLATDIVQTAIDHFRDKYGQEDADMEQKLAAAIQGILPQPKTQAKVATANPSVSSAPISPATVTQALTGIAQNQQQVLQAQAQRIRARKLAASQNFQARQAAGNIPLQSTAVRKSTEASIAAKLLVPINSRMASISKVMGQKLRKFEYGIGQAIKKDFDAVTPFIRGLEAMPKADAQLLDYALKNGDAVTRDQLLQRHNLVREHATALKVIEGARKRAIAAGYEVGQVDDYFPRKVKDLDGLMAHYYGRPDYGVIEKALEAAEKKANANGKTLTPEDRMEIVNSTLQNGQMGQGGPSNIKARKTDIVSVDANQFYASSTEALISYVERMNEAVEKRKFFGRYAVQVAGSPGVSSQLSLEASIGGYVEAAIARGDMSRTQQREAVSIIESRFAGGVTADSVKAFKTMSYLTTMGQLTSSVSQLADLAFSLYESGYYNTSVELAKAVTGKNKITRASLGLDAIAEEFRDTGKMQKILNGTFKAVGIHYLDAIGKETLINSKFRSMVQQAAAGNFSKKTQALLDASFTPAERAQVTADLAAGKQTEDTLFLAYSVLADYQPINRSEYPEYYLRHPNGRIFYMLKVFTLKQIDAFRREGITMIVNGNAKEKVEGFKNIAHLSSLLFLAGVSTDWLKDWIMQRDPQLGDLAVDNLLKLVAINRYSLYQFREKKNLVESTMQLALPPAPFLQYPMTDVMKVVDQLNKGDEVKPGDFESWRILPFVGSAYYWWAGGGKTKIDKKREKENNPPSGRR